MSKGGKKEQYKYLLNTDSTKIETHAKGLKFSNDEKPSEKIVFSVDSKQVLQSFPSPLLSRPADAEADPIQCPLKCPKKWAKELSMVIICIHK